MHRSSCGQERECLTHLVRHRAWTRHGGSCATAAGVPHRRAAIRGRACWGSDHGEWELLRPGLQRRKLASRNENTNSATAPKLRIASRIQLDPASGGSASCKPLPRCRRVCSESRGTRRSLARKPACAKRHARHARHAHATPLSESSSLSAHVCERVLRSASVCGGVGVFARLRVTITTTATRPRPALPLPKPDHPQRTTARAGKGRYLFWRGSDPRAKVDVQHQPPRALGVTAPFGIARSAALRFHPTHHGAILPCFLYRSGIG